MPRGAGCSGAGGGSGDSGAGGGGGGGDPGPQCGEPRITTDDGAEGAAVVGVDTWVWAASGTPSHVEVRATAGSTSVTVAADAGGLSLSAPGPGPVHRVGRALAGGDQPDDSDRVVVYLLRRPRP